LLTTEDPQEAARLARLLDEVNQKRRSLQNTIENAVHEAIERLYHGQPPAAIVLGDAQWHHGVVGIVAAKIAEAYHRPTFLLQIQGDTARGSGRSIPAFNLYHGLQHCARWLQRFGGHKYAAGLSMATVHLPFLQEDFVRFAEDTLKPEDLQPTLRLEAVATLDDLTVPTVLELERCGPHGAGNPLPLFMGQAVRLVAPPRLLGAQQQHGRFRVSQDGTIMEVIAFNMAARVSALVPGTLLDIAFTPAINTWNGQRKVELHLRDLRPAAPLGDGESH
jgi:single-stranded-DNA-specific exonuclease